MSTVLITGASGGIGHAAAIALAKVGHQVIATARRRPSFAAGCDIVCLPLDVTDDTSIAHAFEELKGRPIDVLVNNSGHAEIGPVEDVTTDRFRAQFDTNLLGVVRMVEAVLPSMRARRGGRVVNVSSVAGRIAFPFVGAYCASKFALEGLSISLRLELRSFGIDVVVVELDAVASGFSGSADTALQGAEPRTSAWRDFFDLVALTRRTEARAVSVDVAAAAVVSAVRGHAPPSRMVVPARARRLLALSRLLPSSSFDRMIRRTAGLSR